MGMRGVVLAWAAISCCALAQGATVGVLDPGVALDGLVETLAADPRLSVKVLEDLREDALEGMDVLIIANAYDLDATRGMLRQAVRAGMGLFFMHRTVTDGRAFPEIIWKDAKGELDVAEIPNILKPTRKHPITQGVPPDGFKRTHWKHAYTFPADDRLVLIEDAREEDAFAQRRFRGTQTRWAPHYGGHAVLVASPFGEGRVVFCGVCFGLGPGDNPVKVTGHEKALLMDCVAWLAQETRLALPRDGQADRSSRYRLHYNRRNPAYEPGKVRVRSMPPQSVQAGKMGHATVRFELPGSAPLDQVIPVRLVCPDLEFRPASISVADAAGTLGPRRPVQIEEAKGDTPIVLFTGCFRSRRASVTLSSEPCADAPVVVRLSPNGAAGEVATDAFRVVVAVEEGRPSIQSVQVRDWAWHHTWDGLERDTFSAPILRVAETLRPFEDRPYAIRHERGLALADVTPGGPTAAFPVRGEVLVGEGRLMAYHTGQIQLDGFAGRARLAAWLVDGYAQAGGFTPETGSYDLPKTGSEWLWATRRGRYAIGGTFRLTGRMGETGLAPGLEREAEFADGLMVLTTDVDNLPRLEALPEPVTVHGRRANTSDERRAVPVGPQRLCPRAVTLRKLWRMRGTDEFFPVLPEPVEIYADELARVPAIATWRFRGDHELGVTSAPGRKPTETLPDAALRKAAKTLDPFGEDAGYVWRRLFVACDDGRVHLRPRVVLLEGIDEDGACVLEVPVSVRTVVSVPMGVFTYTSQWIEQRDVTPPEQWAKLMRDIALSDLDYIIHVALLGGEQEGPQNVNNRLKRYGLWWLADIGRPGQAYINQKRTPQARTRLEQQYAQVIGTLGSEPNVIGWMLSEELPSGEAENGVVPQGYADAKLFYDLSGEHDSKRPRINLISVYFTPYETAAEHIESDVFSWDPYGRGTSQAREAAHKVQELWREAKDKPSWITLRCCGPRFWDCRDDWLDIRRRSIAAYKGGVDGINYFMYSHWLTNMRQFTYYAVIPGSQGPIASLRRQALSDISEDVALLSTAEYLLQTTQTVTDKHRATFEEALDLGVEGRFHSMRALLEGLIEEAAGEMAETSVLR